MAFKEKLKGAWRRVSDLDDETGSAKQKAKDNERIPYKTISKKIKEIMQKNVDVVGRKILIPSYYVVYFNEADRSARLEVEDVMCSELKEELYHEMRKINPEQNKGELLIEMKTDPSVEKGEFRIEHKMKKTSENEAAAMQSQAPVQPAGDENDLKQTIVEEAPSFEPDEQKTIVQMPEAETMYNLMVDSGDAHEVKVITKPFITIGRSTQDDVVLESTDFSISRAHASIEVKDGEYYLMPSGINGTLLNGEELELKTEVKISAGDEIKIVNYTLQIQA